MLESYVREKLKKKDILLMTHIVLGYPSFEESFRVVEAMVEAGVDMMELQIPFSEPMADGPVIVKTNQTALERGSTVAKCFDAAREIASRFPIPFLFMSYYNILFKYGTGRFATDMARAGLRGAIIPDVPPEEGDEYLQAMDDNGLSPIFIYAPTTTDQRMQHLARYTRGFVYCVARRGVTGEKTEFSRDLDSYLSRCRRATDLPLAVGFGVKDKGDVDFLKGKADIAVIGTQTIRIIDAHGVDAAGEFIRGIVA
ncbi:MAG: tryptophan synthase subunit alpha [Desulfovibrionales bacterium]